MASIGPSIGNNNVGWLARLIAKSSRGRLAKFPHHERTDLDLVEILDRIERATLQSRCWIALSSHFFKPFECNSKLCSVDFHFYFFQAHFYVINAVGALLLDWDFCSRFRAWAIDRLRRWQMSNFSSICRQFSSKSMWLQNTKIHCWSIFHLSEWISVDRSSTTCRTARSKRFNNGQFSVECVPHFTFCEKKKKNQRALRPNETQLKHSFDLFLN